MSIFTNFSSRTYENAALRRLVIDQKIDRATLQRDYKCVYKPFVMGHGYLVRVCKRCDVPKIGGHDVTYDALDTHPEMVVFDGFLMTKNADQAYLERRKAS